MLANNNLSILPWYTSIEDQNARKWWAYNRIYPLFTPQGFMLPFQLMREHRIADITAFKVYDKNGALIGDFTDEILDAGLTIKSFNDYDVIVFTGQLQVFTQIDEGQYYAFLSDGVETWYSDIFTVVGDISHYVKLVWWDDEDFVMDAGTIVYTNPSFKNILYLWTDIAKPEYDFDEEVIERDGYTFPVKQVSSKKYQFSFLASEYILDVIRLVRLSDYIEIYNGQKKYSLDTFLINAEWEGNGDVASVKAEFTTATVAKKIGNIKI